MLVRKDVIDSVYPIIERALDILQDPKPQEELTQNALQAELLLMVNELRKVDQGLHGNGDQLQVFPGVRCACVCWLDEVFINRDITEDPRWPRWTESKLEWKQFNTVQRATWFWSMAETAYRDAREVFILAVQLGFRGDWTPQRRVWVEDKKAVLARQGREQPVVAGSERHSPPSTLHGQDRLQRMLWVGTIVACVWLVGAVFMLVTHLSRF